MAEEALPDRETVLSRLDKVRNELWQVHGIVHTTRLAMNSAEFDPDAAKHALHVACELLIGIVGSDLDEVELLAPAEVPRR
jgi:hypothetical protein